MSREGDRRGGRVSCALLILLLLNLGVTGCGERADERGDRRLRDL
jgi:hypothetical protein